MTALGGAPALSSTGYSTGAAAPGGYSMGAAAPGATSVLSSAGYPVSTIAGYEIQSSAADADASRGPESGPAQRHYNPQLALGLALHAESQRYQVNQEDCDFLNVVSGHLGTVAPPESVACSSRSSPAIRINAGVLPSPGASNEVYVQDLRNAAQFKAVTPEKASRVYGIQEGYSANARLRPGKRNSTGESNSSRQKIHTIASLRAIALDLDTLLLGSSAGDEQIFDLACQAEGSKLSLAVLFFACQGILFGLSLINFALVFVSRPTASSGTTEKDASKGAAALTEALRVLEPCLTGFTTIFAEIACIGTALRAFWARERKIANRALEPLDLGSDQLNSDSENAILREDSAQLTLCTIAAVANFCVVVSCLLGNANTTALSFYDSPGITGTGTEGLITGDATRWHVTASRLCLGFRSGFSFFALLPVLLDAKYLVSPTLPDMSSVSAGADAEPMTKHLHHTHPGALRPS